MMHSIRLARRTGTLALCCAAAAAAQSTSPLVAPADRALFEGSSSSSYPLGRWNHRLQQLHTALSPNAQTLRGHAYRRDALITRDGIAGFTTELEVTASTAPHGPVGASRSFAANLGGDATVVLPRTTVSFPSTGRPGDAPAPSFAYRIPWSTPFQLAGGAPLCLDVTVHGNQTASGVDRNFALPLDAHEYPANGSEEQPGYRYGSGCSAPGTRRTHSARLTFVRAADGTLSLDIDSRDGVPGSSSSPSLLGMLVGLSASPTPWPLDTSCTMYPAAPEFTTLNAGVVDPQGDWRGELTGLPNLPVGSRFHAQLVSAATAGALTFSDGVHLTVPPGPPGSAAGARIASGSDRSSSTGAVSPTVSVTEFF